MRFDRGHATLAAMTGTIWQRAGRRAVAVFIGAHGVAHGLAFATAWKLTVSPDLPYSTELLGGRVDVGAVGIRVVGILWLLAGAGFVFAALRTWRASALATRTVLGAIAVSTLVCATDPARAKVGLALNAILLLGVARARTPPVRRLAGHAR